jgi:quinone-modifying oxidoreductase subunit QmoA
MVVLATGIVPSDLGLDLLKESNGFHNIDQKYGIYVAGCGKKPMDVSASVKDATAVALKAIQIN